MRRKSVLIVVGVLFAHIMAWGQSSSQMLKRDYPQVYSSIVENVDRQWGDKSNVKDNLIESEANAFYSMINLDSWDWEVLTKAVITFSYPGKQSSNEKIIKDSSIQNPLPFLRCDWYKVKTYYQKQAKSSRVVNERSTPTRSAANTFADNNRDYSRNEPAPIETVSERKSNNQISAQREDSYTDYSQQSDYNTDYYYERKTEKDGLRFGFKVGAGFATLVDASDLEDDVKIKPGFSLEAGVVTLYRKNNLFLQNETSISQLRHAFKIDANQYDEEYKSQYSHLFLQTAVHIGGYARINDDIEFFAGFGGFAAGRLESRYKLTEGNTEYKGRIKDDIKNFNLGISGLIGIQKENFRFALYPSLGLTKMVPESNDKIFSLILGVTYFL